MNTPGQPFARWKPRRPVAWMATGLGALVLLVFGSTVRNGFVNWDDNVYVYDNPSVTPGLTWAGIRWAFTTDNPTGNWHPLTWLSHMLDCQLYGLNASGHHLTNVLLHAATVILLFLWLRQMTGAFGPSALVAAVFAVHPLRVESVAWIAERKDVLSGLFFMLTGWLYTRQARQRSLPAVRFWTRNYALLLFVYALGLMSKPMLVTVPFVLLLLDYWPLQRIGPQNWQTSWRPLLREKLPLFLLAAAVSLTTFFTQRSVGAFAPRPPLLRLENALTSYVTYIQKTFCPDALALSYPYPSAIPLWHVVACGGALVLVTALAIQQARRRPYFLVGWLWYLGMLVPVIGLVPVGAQAFADRYTYLPQIGLLVALTWSVRDAFPSPGRRPPWFLPLTTSSIVMLLAISSLSQIPHWHDSLSLWRHTIACTPPNPVAELKLGQALESSGQRAEAILHYQRSIAIQPDHPASYQTLSLALVQEGRSDEAIESYAKELLLDPNNAAVHNDLANLLAAKLRLDEAAAHYQQALHLQPDFAACHFNYALMLAQHGRLEDAATQFRLAIQYQPENASAHGDLADVLAAQDKTAEAVPEYEQTLRWLPNSDPVHFQLGLALEKLGRTSDAIQQFQQVLQLNPQHAGAAQQLQMLQGLPAP